MCIYRICMYIHTVSAKLMTAPPQLELLGRKQSTEGLVLDFVDALDSVCHKGLLYKIDTFGINPNMVILVGRQNILD